MGYEILVGPEEEETEAYHLGSASAVDRFLKWVEALPESDYPLVKQFAEEFRTTEPHEFSSQLADARDAHTPDENLMGLIYEIGSTAQGLESGTLFRIE